MSTRDLLNFGWELSGIQMSSRWRFVAYSWNVDDLGDAIAKQALSQLDGVNLFFAEDPCALKPGAKPKGWEYITRPELTDCKRIQEVDGNSCNWLAVRTAFNPDRGENASLWIRRCWLRPWSFRLQGCELYDGNRRAEVTPWLERAHAEGGPLVNNAELALICNNYHPHCLADCPGADEFRRKLASSQQEPNSQALRCLHGDYEEMPRFQAAQDLEKGFWTRPGSKMPYEEVFSDYLRGHAYDAARRFFHEAVPFIDDTVSLSNETGQQRFMLAVIEHDEAGIEEALRASDTGSYGDMLMGMIACAERGNFDALAQALDDGADRYSGESKMCATMKGFLPLIPALDNPASADHQKAVDYFGSCQQWPVMQWVLARHAKLSGDELVRFFGGENTDPRRKMLRAVLAGDKDLLDRTYDEFDKVVREGKAEWPNMLFVVATDGRNVLDKVPVPASQPDLMPSGATGLVQAVQNQLNKIAQ